MKIVFGSDSFLPVCQGIATHMILYAKQLSDMGHEVMIMAPNYPGYEDVFLGKGIQIVRIKSHSIRKILKIEGLEDRLVNPFRKKLVKPILDAFQPDIIHCHTEFSMGRLLLSYAKKNEIPVVMTFHIYFEYYMQFYFPKLPKFLTRSIARMIQYHFFKHAHSLISPTMLMEEKIKSYGIKQNVVVIPTGMLLSDFKIEQPQELESFAEQHPVFKKDVLLFVGRIVEEKNVVFLLEAFRLALAKKPDIYLVYVGAGIYKPHLQKKVMDYALGDRVFFYDQMPREELKYYYFSCKLFVFPSLGETQGLVVLEAMSCGKPVVGIDAMGVGETMEHRNYGGLISQPGDLNQYVENIIRLLEDPELYREKSTEAYEIAKKWDIAKWAQDLESSYSQLLEEAVSLPYKKLRTR